MYRYLVSKLIDLKVEMRSIILQNICSPRIWGPGEKIDFILVLANYSSALQKPITNWYYIPVVGILTKTCTIFGVAI